MNGDTLTNMIVPAESSQLKALPDDQGHFTGRVLLERLPGSPTDGASLVRVLFEPGARTHAHRHPGGQILYVVSGVGYVGDLDDQVGQRITPGDIVYAAPNEWHWHGAGPDTFMVHLAVNLTNGIKGGDETDWNAPTAEPDTGQG